MVYEHKKINDDLYSLVIKFDTYEEMEDAAYNWAYLVERMNEEYDGIDISNPDVILSFLEMLIDMIPDEVFDKLEMPPKKETVVN